MADESADYDSESDGADSGSGNSGAALKAFGGATQGIGALIQGMAQGNALDFQATVAGQNANEAIDQGNFNAQKSQLISGERIGAIQAGYGASGVSGNSGSAAAVLMSSASNAELDRLNILHGADIKATNFQNQMSLDRMGASSSRTGGFLNGVSGLVTSGAALALLA